MEENIFMEGEGGYMPPDERTERRTAANPDAVVDKPEKTAGEVIRERVVTAGKRAAGIVARRVAQYFPRSSPGSERPRVQSDPEISPQVDPHTALPSVSSVEATPGGQEPANAAPESEQRAENIDAVFDRFKEMVDRGEEGAVFDAVTEHFNVGEEYKDRKDAFKRVIEEAKKAPADVNEDRLIENLAAADITPKQQEAILRKWFKGRFDEDKIADIMKNINQPPPAPPERAGSDEGKTGISPAPSEGGGTGEGKAGVSPSPVEEQEKADEAEAARAASDLEVPDLSEDYDGEEIAIHEKKLKEKLAEFWDKSGRKWAKRAAWTVAIAAAIALLTVLWAQSLGKKLGGGGK